MTLAAAAAPPAGGAETGQVLVVTLAVTLVVLGLLALGLRHRRHPLAVVAHLDRLSRSVSGLPGWAGIPAAVTAACLGPALFGLQWDEALHVNDGRDEGPLANPSHYLLLLGLLGTFAAGWLSLVLPAPGERPGPVPVRITKDWHVPLGGVLLTLSGSFALVGFPLDDVSHRLFGQDVTLWGTTHLWMMSGAVGAVLALLLLVAEGRPPRAQRRSVRRTPLYTLVSRLRMVLAAGGLLAGLSIFQGEFDYGIAQFQLLFHPVTLAGTAAIALVAARLLGGPGGALVAIGFFLVLRGTITLILGPGLDELTNHFPLYLAEAVLVELAALVFLRRGGTIPPLAFGVVCGALIGTLGVLAEHAWSHIWMPVAWPASMLPEALAWSLPVALAGGVLGALLAAALQRRSEIAGTARAARLAVAGIVVIVGVLAALRPTDAPEATATITLEEVRPAPEREVVATVRIDPAQAASDATYVRSIAWQGGERLRTGALREVAPGVWRTAPLPAHGTWKSLIVLHDTGELASVPVFLPADEAIPVEEVPAVDATRPFVELRDVMQRERKDDVSVWVERGAAFFVLGAVLALLALFVVALGRLARSGRESDAPPAVRVAARPREPAAVA